MMLSRLKAMQAESSPMARIRETIRRGAPRTTDEARQLMAIVRECFPGAPSEWEGRLSAALTEILIGTVLHQPTYEARAQAVEALDAMERDLRKM